MTDLWTLEKRLIDLRNCAYLMIATGNSFHTINPLAVIASRGLTEHVSTKRFKSIWEEQSERFEREQLTKCVNSNPVEGK